MNMMNFAELKEDWGYDFGEVMNYADFKEDDIQSVVAHYEGTNDEEDWKLVVKLNDGRFGAVKAGCDYTGWG